MRKKTEKQQRSTARDNRSGKTIMIGLGACVLLGGGYLAYNYIKNKAALNRGDLIINQLPPVAQVNQVVAENSNRFPLKAGARGNLVQMMQTALLAIGGKAAQAIQQSSIKPNGQSDGIFGKGTQQALAAAGLPATVSQEVFASVIAQGKSKLPAGGFDSAAVAKAIKAGAEKQNIFAVLNALAKIPNVAGYQAVSKHFMNVRIRGTRVTSLVNALLSVAFASNEASKVKIRAEFERMGLVNRDGRWALSGLGVPNQYTRELFKLAVTKKPTLLKEGSGAVLNPVLPKRQVVGYVTGGKQGVIQVYTPQGNIVYAPAKNLRLI